MPIFPVRNLAKYGVISDVDPYNLPTEAFSAGINVRFRNGSIQRAPVFRTVSSSLLFASPRFLSANTIPGSDPIILAYLNGRVTKYVGGSESDISIAGFVNNNAEAAYTACNLGNVYYINRSDRSPWYMRQSDSQFQVLASAVAGQWPTNYFANIIRSSNSALIAFGINKGGTLYPQMVKTSEFTQTNVIPPNWDPTVTGTNATENILAEMTGGITDALGLGEIMIVYGINETWTMVMDGSTNVWAYHRIFNDAGSINTNCSVEVDRKHFVFGRDDLWMHDGTTKRSICDQRTRQFVFSGFNIAFANRCFVAHNQNLKEIYFCFYSGDAYTGFLPVDGCNRAAVYNYATDTWTYDDLPYVYGGWRGNVSTTSATYANTSLLYSTAGGSYLSLEDSTKKTFIYVGDVNATYSLSKSLYAFDLQGPGSQANLPVDTNATRGWTLIRDGIDLDEVGVDLKGYKVINSIYPQARLEANAQPLTFTVGAGDYFNDVITFDDPQTYDGSTLYKLDYNMPGRYLSFKITHNDYHYVNLTGYDVDLDVTGER